MLSVASPPPTAMRDSREKPAEITILTVLEILSGLLFFALAFNILVNPSSHLNLVLFPFLAINDVISVFGVIMTIFGIINFVTAYSLWKGLEWAWTLSLVFTVLDIMIGLPLAIPGSLTRVPFDLSILYYLTRWHVKKFFRKELEGTPPFIRT